MDMYLVFVYNANGGPISEMLNWTRKILKPAVSPCRLLALTQGTLGTRESWKRFLAGVPFGKRFIYRDEMQARYGLDAELPAILIQKDGNFETWITAAEINRAETLDALIALLHSRLHQLIAANRWHWIKLPPLEQTGAPALPLDPAPQPAKMKDFTPPPPPSGSAL